MTKVIFQQEYSEESLYDLDRDISECVNPQFNSKLKGLDTSKGTFVVTVTYMEEENAN